MSGFRFGLAACLTALLTGCASTSGPQANASNSPASTPSSQATAVSSDPCLVITAAEASSLTGATYTEGKEETTSGGSKICTYGSQTLDVFEVLIAQAADAATAQSTWAQEEGVAQQRLKDAASQLPSASLTVNDVSIAGADRAAVGTFSATFSGRTFAAAAVYLLKGPYFLSFSDLVVGKSAPTADAMQAEAATALGRLP